MKPKLEFDAWWEQLKVIAEKNGFTMSPGMREDFIKAQWRDYYDAGMSPQTAWKKA